MTSGPTPSPSACASSRAARPRLDVHHDDGSRNYADLVEAIAEKAGQPLMAWQVGAVSHWSATDASGQFVHRRVGASIPRQAGKTTMAMMYAIFLSMCLGARVLWTAHNYSTTCKTLEDFKDVLGARVRDEARGVPYFNNHVSRVSNKTAQEAYWFSPFYKGAREGCVQFSTRTRTATLGDTYDVIFLDEAQEVTHEHLQAILPTTSSGPMHNPQYVYMGTPRRAGSAADRFEDMRRQAVEGGEDASDLCWVEYGLSEVGDVRDESRWYEANPSLAAGVANVSAIRAMLPQLGTVAFAQECLGVWLSPLELAGGAGAPVIGMDDWLACATPGEPPASPRAYAVKFSSDGQTFGVCVAVPDGDGVWVELVDHRASVGAKRALAEFVSARAMDWPVAIDGKAGADSLVERLDGSVPGANVVRPGSAGVVSANAGLVDAVAERRLRWHAPEGGADGADELSRCVTTATRRPIGRDGGWGFDGDGSDVAEAAALAVWKAQDLAREEPMEVFF